MRFLVSGPVSSMRWVPSGLAHEWMTPRGPKRWRKLGKSLSRVVALFGLFFGVEVVQVAEELVEAVHGGQELVAVAEVVLAELAGGVAVGPQRPGDGGVGVAQANRRARHAHLGEAGAVRVLAGHERGAPRGATLLAVVVGEAGTFGGDAVDVGGAIPHHAVAVTRQVRDADVVAPDDQDVRLFGHGSSVDVESR
jgi:hypothetical protein